MLRTMRRIMASVALAGWLAAGCGSGPAAGPPPPRRGVDPAAVDGERALAEVEALVALGLRDSGTPGAEAAAAHIRDRLQALGLAPAVDAFTDPTPRGEVVFRNVLADLPGTTADWVVIASHYDTMSGMAEGFEGANDSGSSTGLLLELARALAAAPRAGPRVRLAFLDGEERMVAYGPRDGLHGSRRLARAMAADGARVAAVIVIDMIGDRDLTVTIPRNVTPELVRAAFAAAVEEGVRDRFSLFGGEILDDHVPFLELGMPAVVLIDFEYGSAPGRNDYWHTADDTLDKLSADSMQTVGRVVVRMLNRLSEAGPAGP